MPLTTRNLGLSLALVLLAAADTSAAQDRSTDLSFMVGGTVSAQGVADTPRPSGVGFGARAGVLFEDLRLYSGLVGTYVPGSRGDYAGFDVNASRLQLGGELGYELSLGSYLALRPSLGAGASFSSIVGGQDAKLTTRGFLAPALSLSVRIGDVRVGLDGRYSTAVASWEESSVSVFGTIGLRLRNLGGKLAGGPRRTPRSVETARVPGGQPRM